MINGDEEVKKLGQNNNKRDQENKYFAKIIFHLINIKIYMSNLPRI